jgi:hypothetical protein
MKNLSINELKNLLSSREQLAPIQLFSIKGGDGEDLRRDTTSSLRMVTTTTTTTAVTTTIKSTRPKSTTAKGTGI